MLAKRVPGRLPVLSHRMAALPCCLLGSTPVGLEAWNLRKGTIERVIDLPAHPLRSILAVSNRARTAGGRLVGDDHGMLWLLDLKKGGVLSHFPLLPENPFQLGSSLSEGETLVAIRSEQYQRWAKEVFGVHAVTFLGSGAQPSPRP